MEYLLIDSVQHRVGHGAATHDVTLVARGLSVVSGGKQCRVNAGVLEQGGQRFRSNEREIRTLQLQQMWNATRVLIDSQLLDG